jgi:Phospholipase_D-nuclease N-terminal
LDITTHPFLNVMWTFFIVFFWISVFILLIRIISDIFKREDIGGGAKAVWAIFVIFLPLLGCLVYMIREGSHLGHRDLDEARAAQAAADADRIAQAGPDGASVAAEIERAKALFDAGSIDEAEFQQIKSRAITYGQSFTRRG